MTNVQSKSIWGILLQLQLTQPSEAFMEALIQDSNYENEWLYTATETQNTLEIRYCLERALYINPKNIHTAHRLAKLNRQMNTVREEAPVEQRSFFNRITNFLYQTG
jgi:hypothetical protein